MTRHWTFGQKVGLGFAAIVMLALTMSIVAVHALKDVVNAKDRVIDVNAQLLIDAELMRLWFERKVANSRGYFLTGDRALLDRMRESRDQFGAALQRAKRTVYTDEARELLSAVERSERAHQTALDGVIELRRKDASIEEVVRRFDDEVVPKRDEMDKEITGFIEREGRLLGDAKAASSRAAASAIDVVIAMAAGMTLLACIVAIVLTRLLGSQVGSAIGFVRSSSVELQASANQQAAGATEQATAMSEITTTINELLATSRQIAASAQRVAQIASQTASSARAGDATVGDANASMVAIQRQVELIVGHMLDLGKKSQQIGAVLEIVSELAEQTNILAINASIEAAGAGESGRRFAVVADEIRKLADRVSGSTKEVRALIDDVRAAVNTTVMATESGSKAVEAGSKQFEQVATSFKQIAALVGTTTEAAKEIELSTKQQSTAVEQVNLAIGQVADATRENQASSTQTLQTVSQLARLSKDLSKLVESRTST